MAEIKSLEHSTLKVPYEVLNKKFRSAQKNLDRELDQIQNVSRDAEKILNRNNALPTVFEVSKLVGNVVQRLQILKRKAEESLLDELNAGLVCKRKLQHLRIVAPPDSHISLDAWQASMDQWKRIRMDRIVIEHLLRRGFYETAECLARKSDIRHLTNLDIFHTSREVEDDLTKHKTLKCVLWCMDNKSKLRKINSNMEFSLRVQEFVELVRSDNRVEAVKHARKYFQAFEKTQLKEICKCMALLAYQPNTETEPYKSLFSKRRWKDLALNFRNENYRLFQLSTQSLLSVAIQAGLSALKTPQCYSSNCKSIHCPVCQEDFNQIAKNLPYSHCVQSRLICRITGLPLNEHNLPMMLPNGQIFGQLAVPEITKEDGAVVCPITNTTFSNPKVEKVFVM
ncbi:E3 ubiquitin-protein transferase MAEA [Anastrepha obliqua]|uniref:E3 ubiquitin-protein transferase MAEA n=1 Tax=Anastrepha ludens TaxID=28586 RepID=UPI0023AED89D|nr:E3 ubiquitin-protein transferase MAEA [Anastrepha ludens]XP_054725666.1 E3 ubiquitin-protein transferase MAEA [Anastrepha obliqua]